jgi:hypothetical protein
MQAEDTRQLFERIKQLPVDQQIDLVQALLDAAGLQVVLGGSNKMSGNIIIQVNMSDRQTLAEVLDVMSERLKREA